MTRAAAGCLAIALMIAAPAAAQEPEDGRVEAPQRKDKHDGRRMGETKPRGQVLGGQFCHCGLCISLISVVRMSGARSSV